MYKIKNLISTIQSYLEYYFYFFNKILRSRDIIKIKDFGDIFSSYFSYSADENIRFSSSSGGFCKSFLVYLIESGEVDAAIITRTGSPESPLISETIITNSISDIVSTRTNSVYAPANPLSALKSLEENKSYVIVLTGCSVRDLRLIQKNGLAKNIKIVIGLMCSQIPKIDVTKKIINMLEIKEEDIRQIEYRGNGWPGGFTAHLKDGSKKFTSEAKYWSKDFGSGIERCQHCSEMSSDADIVLCDPWNLGLEKVDKIGTTMVIARNKTADLLIREANKAGYIKLLKCTIQHFLKAQGAHIKRKRKIKENVIKMEKNKNEILVWYWRSGEKYINFGEHIVEILIKEFGYNPRAYSDAQKKNELKNYNSCLIIIGSELHKDKIDWFDVPKVVVWGQGKGQGDFFDINDEKYSKKVSIFAVRGPNTIRQLKLRSDIPTGDPGFLLSLLFPIKKDESKHKIVYIPHHTNRKNIQKRLKSIGAEKYINIMFKKENFFETLTEIVSSRFVLTNSLHIVIAAQSYHVPWALCLAEGESLNMPDKWKDIFEYLGILNNFKIVKNYEEGIKWWKEVGVNAKVPSLLPLIKSFPYPIKNKKVIDLVNELENKYEN